MFTLASTTATVSLMEMYLVAVDPLPSLNLRQYLPALRSRRTVSECHSAGARAGGIGTQQSYVLTLL